MGSEFMAIVHDGGDIFVFGSAALPLLSHRSTVHRPRSFAIGSQHQLRCGVVGLWNYQCRTIAPFGLR